MSQTQDPMESQYDSQSDLAFMDFSANDAGSQLNSQQFGGTSQLHSSLTDHPIAEHHESGTEPLAKAHKTIGNQNASPSVTKSSLPCMILETQTQNDMHSQIPSMDARVFDTQSQMGHDTPSGSQIRNNKNQTVTSASSTTTTAAVADSSNSQSKKAAATANKTNISVELDDDDDLELEFQQFDEQHPRRSSRHGSSSFGTVDASQSQTQTEADTLPTQMDTLGGLHKSSMASQISESSLNATASATAASLNDPRGKSHAVAVTQDTQDTQDTVVSSTSTVVATGDDVDEDDDDDADGSTQTTVANGRGGAAETSATTSYDQQKLPSHACAYCGIHSTSCVVRCDVCEKWFCNARSSHSAGTHIIHHLVRSKHKHVSLHKECPIGETSLECYNCGTRNIFLLGFVPATSDGVVVLLCREQCLHIEKLREMEWDGNNWQPLIKDRELLDWLVQNPTQNELSRCRQISTEQMNGLEELWKTNPHAKNGGANGAVNGAGAGGAGGTLTDIDKIDSMISNDQVDHVLITYEDAQHFQRIYAPLVTLEGDYDKRMKESQSLEGVEIRWDFNSLGKKRLIHFRKGSYRNQTDLLSLATLATGNGVDDDGGANRSQSNRSDGGEFRVVPGDELLIQHAKSGWQCNGTVSSVADDDNNDDITIELRTNTEQGSAPNTEALGYRIEFVWKSTSFDRQQFAMRTLIADDYSVTAYLYHLLMGHEVVPQILEIKNLQKKDAAAAKVEAEAVEDDEEEDEDALRYEFNAPGLPKLNHSQQAAVKHCLQQPLSLIQGPPGTGKTVTSATIVYHLTKQNQGQVLVSAPSNIAVDQLTMKIHQTGLKVVRLTAKSREAVPSSVDFLCLHNLVIQVAQIQNNELYKWHKLKAEMGELTPKDSMRYRRLVRETEKKLLQSADVICVTCVGAGDPRLKDFRFKQVLIDESTQATEPECLIPIVMGSKQIVLVGDHCQLGPVIMCKKAAQAGLQRSLFERLILLNIKPVRLQVQYRMHPCLSEFPSNTFYEGSLQNGVAKEHRTEELLSEFWPNPSMPMFFYSSMGREEFAASGTSYLNRAEAQNVEKIITFLMKTGIKPHQIGVVTPYEGQRQYILTYMQRKGTLKESIYEIIEVASVDAFQGREKDFIILSCVRSNNNQGIGFLNDPRRLNVALTRAKFGLIIVGNPTVLSRQNLWNNLLTHFKAFGLLVEGDLHNLKRCMIQLASIKKYNHRKRHMQPVMPRTFGDQIPRRHFHTEDPQGYGNRNQLQPYMIPQPQQPQQQQAAAMGLASTPSSQYTSHQQFPAYYQSPMAMTANPNGGIRPPAYNYPAPPQQPQYQQQWMPAAAQPAQPVPQHAVPPPQPHQQQVAPFSSQPSQSQSQISNYAYPGMITQTDLNLGVVDRSNNSVVKKSSETSSDRDVDRTDSTEFSVDELKQNHALKSTPIAGTENTNNNVMQQKGGSDMMDVSRSSVAVQESPTQSQFTQEHDMDIITASQIDRLHSHHHMHRATSPTSQLHFSSLGLTQDPQIQSIVQEMDQLSKKYEKKARK
eukprot:CAMPEP_0202686102 /NCGR_PEP_ID=MMETSP1385-20130828/1897_1 /ASSEMBLY_ACC=CAM_ASM_000861 /TAXON_ID=933848 /ORGANISM="Elphidium margaritaceum" /LENGTH=1530 /DNA_ID=CAMNT_0049340613 /DNA_START=46 /DNA_END=4638 /DNA_ORIENTATION=-